MTLEFQKFPKIPRLNRNMIVTEKIDGTNACVAFGDDGSEMLVQSRNRVIVPGDDNAGFAAWCYENRDALWADLGPGRHFGEWWGRGIQRNYGVDYKAFSLFNVSRWTIPPNDEFEFHSEMPFETPGLGVVPVLYQGDFSHEKIREIVAGLAESGSVLVPGASAEGVVVYLPAAQQLFKVLCENDEIPKGAVA